MKKPMSVSPSTPLPPAKLILKLHKENLPSYAKLHALDPLLLVRTAAHHQQIRVAQLIHEINK